MSDIGIGRKTGPIGFGRSKEDSGHGEHLRLPSRPEPLSASLEPGGV